MVSITEQFDTFLRLTPQDTKLIHTHRDFLTQGTRGFAAYYHARLRENPSVSSLQDHYRNNREGLDELLRGLENYFCRLFGRLNGVADQANGNDHPYARTTRSAWVAGSYRAYFEFLKTLIAQSDLPAADRSALDEVLFKILLGDMRAILASQAQTAADSARDLHMEMDQVQAQMTSVLANIPQLIWSVDTQTRRPVYVSPHARIAGIEMEMPIPALSGTLAEDREAVEQAWQAALRGEPTEVESRVRGSNGEIRWFRRTFHPFFDARDKVARIDGVMEEITKLRNAMERLENMASIDALTGLANRTRWQERLSQAIVHADQHDQQVVVMVTDLNHFKAINYTIGHSIGDDVLRQVAHRLAKALPDVDMLARLGGDEFGILLETPAQQAVQIAETVARRINESLTQSISHAGREFYVSSSTGIALYPEHGPDANTLLSRADIAMYRAKRNDAGFLFYHAETDGPTADRLQLSHRLREAISRNELELDFQPKVDVRSKKLCGVEALIRWRNPVYGLVQPDGFIPMAEQMGFINPITDWVISQACEQYAFWAERGLHLPVAVNVSAQSLNPGLVESIRTQLEEKRIPASALQIEITENSLLDDARHAEATVAALHALGISIAIDDFGTGYSSLNRLKNLPIATLKIDKSFVKLIADSDQDAVIVRSIIDLGHNLGFDVVAEGVEQAEALSVLDALECDEVQGFYISRPLNARQLGNWIINSPWQIQRAH